MDIDLTDVNNIEFNTDTSGSNSNFSINGTNEFHFAPGRWIHNGGLSTFDIRDYIENFDIRQEIMKW